MVAHNFFPVVMRVQQYSFIHKILMNQGRYDCNQLISGMIAIMIADTT